MVETNSKDLAKLKDTWKPNPKQAEFLAIPHSIKEAAYLGGVGTGKSDLLLLFGILNRWHEVSQWKQVFMRRTFPELKNEILGRAREYYSKFGATFNKTDMIWTFPRLDQYGAGIMGNAGAQIFLGHCEHDDDVHQYDSMQICLFTPDELTSFTRNIYEYVSIQRNRAPVGIFDYKNDPIPSITRAAGMPGGIGHTWVKKRFIDPCKEGGVIIEGKGGNKRFFIHATCEDNKDHLDPTYSTRLDGLPEAERRAKKFGDFDAYLGQVFEEFRDVKFEDEPDNALHKVEPFEVPSYWPKFITIDWGFRAMCWVGFFAVSPNKRVYLYKELTWTKTKIAEWGPIVKSFMDDGTRFIRVCKSAGQDRGQDHTIQGEIERELGRSVELTLNSPGSRLAGKILMHEYLRWTQKPRPKPSERPTYNEELAMQIYRTRGQKEYESYLTACYDTYEEETNLPKYQIFCCSKLDHTECTNCCPEAINSIKACNYAENKGNKVAEDVAEFEGDDPYDGQRYGLDAAEKLFNESSEEFEKFKKQSELEMKLLNSGNWTAFYRNAEKLEGNKGLTVVNTFHKGRR